MYDARDRLNAIMANAPRAETTGPLTVKVAAMTHYGEQGDVAIVDAQGCIVAETFERVGPGDLRDAKKLADLLAAAPDLLAACEAALKALRPLAGDTATLREIQRAIARAHGEATP